MKIKLNMTYYYYDKYWDFYIPSSKYVLVNSRTNEYLKCKNNKNEIEKIYSEMPNLKKFHTRFFKRFP